MEMTIKKPEFAEATLVKLESIAFDDAVQQRDVIANKKSVENTVSEYAERWREGHEFPPIELCDTGDQILIIDGTLRCLSAKEAGRTEIKARICKGTKADAIFWACSANSDHGLQVNTNEDKRRRTTTILKNAEFMARFPSNGAIGKYLRVSEGFVRKIKVELGIEKPETVAVHTADGRSYDLPSKNIGSGAKRNATEKKSVASEHAKQSPPPPTKTTEKAVSASEKVSSRKPDKIDCASFDEVIREAGELDLIITDLPTPECWTELRELAPSLLGSDQIVLMLVAKSSVSSPNLVSDVVKCIAESSGNVLGSKGFRGGTSEARSRYFGMSPDLAIRRPSQSKPNLKATTETGKAEVDL